MSRWRIGGWNDGSQTRNIDVIAKPAPHSVCLLTNAYPDFPESNRVVFIRTLAHLLSHRGWKVSVVAPRIFAGSQPFEREGEIEVWRFSSFMGGRLLIEYARTPVVRLSGYMMAGTLSAIECVRKNQCELIHAHWVVPAGLIALVAGKVCNVPVVVTAHGSDILVTPGRSAALRRVVKLVLEHAHAVTSVAEHLTVEIARMGIASYRVLTFPMSVPTELFYADSLPEKKQPSQVIFSNRSLYPLYNVGLLIRAIPSVLEEVPDAEVFIAGEGTEAGKLASLARELGIEKHVRFLGAIPHDQMPQYLRQASVYVSTALSDGASVSLLEAMACGTFPVVADIAANREWIADSQNGFLFDPKSVKALAEKIGESLRRPDLRASAREVNVQLVNRKAQWNLNIEKLLGVYETLTAR